jgi:hypothetical protein
MILARPIAAPCFAVLLIGAATCGRAQPSDAGDSPFLPPASPAANGPQSQASPYELTGSLTTSRGIEVCIFDSQAKRSHWIPVGSAYGDIQAVSYDAAGDRAVIRVHGSPMSLSMRKAVVAGMPSQMPGLPSPMPTVFGSAGPPFPRNPPPVVQPPSPEIAKQEREARMLVSDLMDIGMQQRKAHEEAVKAEQAQQAAKPN